MNYSDARAVVEYLRSLRGTGSVVAVPVWRSFLKSSLEDRGLAADGVVELAPPAELDKASWQEYADDLTDVMRSLYHGFIAAAGEAAWTA
jgi:hypothetical protein